MYDYNDYIKKPLYIEDATLLSIKDADLRYKFAEQKEKAENIKAMINLMRNECIECLRTNLENIYEQDRIFAEVEDMIRTFAKTEPKR